MTDLAESPRPIINRMEDCGNGRHVGWWEYDGLLGDHHLLIEIQPDAVVFAAAKAMGILP